MLACCIWTVPALAEEGEAQWTVNVKFEAKDLNPAITAVVVMVEIVQDVGQAEWGGVISPIGRGSVDLIAVDGVIENQTVSVPVPLKGGMDPNSAGAYAVWINVRGPGCEAPNGC